MGPPTFTTNGNAVATENGTSNGLQITNGLDSSAGLIESTEASDLGPHQLPADILGHVKPYHPEGNLMYQDDIDWTPIEDDDIPMEDIDGSDDAQLDDEGHGSSSSKHVFGKRMPAEREEVVRLILQGLHDMGYSQAAGVLSKESGYTLASPAALEFQAAILEGRWHDATALLPELGITPDAPVATSLSAPSSSRNSVRSGREQATGHDNPADQALFLIAQQKYLEYLESSQQKKALAVLRNELATSANNSDALHELSSYMMCLDRDDLYERANWDGASGISRRQLLERLQAYISPKIMVPSRRLATLLDQSRRYQQQNCLYHDSHNPVSLYTDHQCDSGLFPTIPSHILADHTDEVWHIEWSPNGNYLASAGKDGKVVIWQLKRRPTEPWPLSPVPLHHLHGHKGEVDAVSWSPDGTKLVTASTKQVYVWNVKTGALLNTPQDPSVHNDVITAIHWMPDGSQFVVSSLDYRLVFYSPDGQVMRNWIIANSMIFDFAITPDSTRIVVLTTLSRRVVVQNKSKPSISRSITELTTPCGPGSGPSSSTATGTVSAPNTVSGRLPNGDSTKFEYSNMISEIQVIRIAEKEITDYVSNIARNSVTSLKLSTDGKRVLVSCSPDELQMYTIEPHLRLVRKFSGHVQDHFCIVSSFGAPKDRYILSGSEDGYVYVWQSNNSTTLHVLKGHDATVNAVAWNPVFSRRMFASCGDDHKILIWQPPVDMAAQTQVAATFDPSQEGEPDEMDHWAVTDSDSPARE